MQLYTGIKILSLSATLSLMSACTSEEKKTATIADETPEKAGTSATSEPAFKKEGTLSFISAKGDTVERIDIEIASNDAERMQGLMYRTSINEKTGMLFLFDHPEMQSFWMKNTPSSLDIMFISPDMTILNIHAFTQPYAETNYPSTGLSNLVLEVRGGYCQQHGIKAGDKIAYTLLYQ